MADHPESGELEIVCPLCHGRLLVDVQTGAVLDARPQRRGGDIDELLGDVQQEESRRDSEFSRAFEQEKKRRELLEKKFRLAREKSGQDPGGRGDPHAGS